MDLLVMYSSFIQSIHGTSQKSAQRFLPSLQRELNLILTSNMCMHKYIVEEERKENQLILKLQNNKNQFKTILFLLLTLSQLHINDKSPALP